MNKREFKKLYSHYRRVIFDFNADMTNSNYPCGYDDMLSENMHRNTVKWLEANPVIKAVLNQLDSYDFQFGYQAITEEFRNFRYQNSWEVNGKIVWYNRSAA